MSSEEITLQSAVDLFLSEQIESTAKSYSGVLRDMLLHLGPACAISDVESYRLLQYRQVIWKRPYRPATRYKYVKTIRTFFNWLVRNKLIAESPAATMKQETLTKLVPEDKAMPNLALARLLHYTSFDLRLDSLVRFLADTGCRRGGAAGLRVRDINLITCEATVTEKGGQTRLVAFGESTRKSLAGWLAANRFTPDDYVFGPRGKRMKSPALAQLFRRTCIAAGIGSWGPHSLRHRKGHQFAHARIAPSIAATALGHSDIRITVDRYYPRDFASAKEALNELALPDLIEEAPEDLQRFK